MKKLFLKILFFHYASVLFYSIFIQVDGNTDPYYKRFTTPTNNSLILGVSKAAQGLQPQVFNNILNRKDLFNYSFTISSSPYGKLYLKYKK